jgi:hypothetical protein
MIECVVYYKLYRVMTSLTTFLPLEVAGTTPIILWTCNWDKWWSKLVYNLSMDVLYVFIDMRLQTSYVFMDITLNLLCL